MTERLERLSVRSPIRSGERGWWCRLKLKRMEKWNAELKCFNPLTVQKHLDQFKSLYSSNLLKTMYGSFKKKVWSSHFNFKCFWLGNVSSWLGKLSHPHTRSKENKKNITNSNTLSPQKPWQPLLTKWAGGCLKAFGEEKNWRNITHIYIHQSFLYC